LSALSHTEHLFDFGHLMCRYRRNSFRAHRPRLLAGQDSHPGPTHMPLVLPMTCAPSSCTCRRPMRGDSHLCGAGQPPLIALHSDLAQLLKCVCHSLAARNTQQGEGTWPSGCLPVAPAARPPRSQVTQHSSFASADLEHAVMIHGPTSQPAQQSKKRASAGECRRLATSSTTIALTAVH